MTFIETSLFSKLIEDLMPDDEYRSLQGFLNVFPDAGDIISGSGGLRKIRWGNRSTGKRGGLRFIYYWIREPEKILMLYVYKKNKQENLTQNQMKILKKIVEEELL